MYQNEDLRKALTKDVSASQAVSVAADRTVDAPVAVEVVSGTTDGLDS